MSTSTTIKISNDLLEQARRYAQVYKRSVSKQVEYWSFIGKTLEENPDMSYSFIKDILVSLQEAKENETTSYTFG